MKSTRLLLALALTANTGLAMAADAPSAATSESTGAIPATPDEWVRHLSDFTRNADMLVDPKKFVAALNEFTDPSFLVAAMNAMLDPALYNKSLASAMDPKAYGNYARLMDPNVATRWMMTLMDPQFVNAVTYTLMDPAAGSQGDRSPAERLQPQRLCALGHGGLRPQTSEHPDVAAQPELVQRLGSHHGQPPDLRSDMGRLADHALRRSARAPRPAGCCASQMIA